MSPAGTRTCVILGAIALAIGLTSGDKIDTPIPCRNTTDCRSMPTLPQDAFCKDGHCMCPKADIDMQHCSSIDASMHENKTEGPLVYRICSLDVECNFEGGICNRTNRQCVCSKNYVPSSDNRRCVQKAQSYEASCTDKNQCLALLTNSTCVDGKCICEPGYHYVDDTCWKVLEYGEACTKNQECSQIEGAICNDNMTCGCAAEMVLNVDGDKCLMAVRKISDECTESVQCTETFQYSICVDKVCQCVQGYHYESEMTRCFPNKVIGEECLNSYECYQAEDYESDPPIKSVTCISNICTCADNYVKRERNAGCVNAGSSLAVSLLAIVCAIALVVLP